MAEDMIERVARAIVERWNDDDAPSPVRVCVGSPCRLPPCECAEIIARAAIEAMGDPTGPMISAATNKAAEIGAGDFVGIWRAMIDAALSPGA
ncbi:MAG: hypothetical protein JWN66_4990 [Sphingomonas bacterium]|uniref:hypothetical protein n=1 Tax=Sphingomonas bacterium TaxID=1895847 RepID=UPI0026348389|nr:hypothetical protein [Sphingomonas bacterium]MDB5707874.1 hypothetical protein [Sphingomonas bacterium]